MNHIAAHIMQILQPEHSKDSWKFHLITNWHTILGPIADKVTIQKIYNNSILLGVIDSCWMQEMHLLSDLIIKKINANLNNHCISSIKFKYAPNNMHFKRKEKKSVIAKQEIHPLNSSERAVLQKIKDPELALALQGFLNTCHQFS